MVYGPPIPLPPITYRFVPWVTGTDITRAQDTYGFRWFLTPIAFAGINESGRYLITNNCDAYLIVSQSPPVYGSLSGLALGSVVLPPFTAGIYELGTDSFYICAICAGYEFGVTRAANPDNIAFLQTRGPLAYVGVTSLSRGEEPSVQPQLRTGWVRTYDKYDATWLGANGNPLQNSLIPGATVGPAPKTVLLGAFDFTGAKSVSAYVQFGTPTATQNVSLRLFAFSPGSFGYLVGYSDISSWPVTGSPTYQIAVTNNTTNVATTGGLFGVYLLVYFDNNSGANTLTINDVNISLLF